VNFALPASSEGAALLCSDSDLARFFIRNPGIIDTAEGVGRRLGLSGPAILSELEELVHIGLLAKKELGGHELFLINRAKLGRLTRTE